MAASSEGFAAQNCNFVAKENTIIYSRLDLDKGRGNIYVQTAESLRGVGVRDIWGRVADQEEQK